MSSLRLALKQSLQESGLQSSSSSERRKKKRKKKARQKTYHNDDNNNNESHSGESSEENEFSAQDESDDDDESKIDNTNRERLPRRRRKGTTHGNSDDDSDSDTDSSSSSSSSSSILPKKQQHHYHQHQQQRKSPDMHQHDEHRKKQHSAANTIQNRWKKKQESMPPEDDEEDENEDEDDEDNRNESDHDNDADNDDENDDADDDSEREHGDRKSKQSNKQQGAKSSNTSTSRSKHKQSGSKSEITTKAMTVSSPDPSIIEWMRNMPVKKSRRSIVPGMRVKVRFETKVLVRRKEKKNDSGTEQTTTKKEIVQKKKWFGGRVSAVSKEGSKIRIKYDDGTTEVTKFPDNDVVVDDTDNGEHQVPADVFIPPGPPPPESPPQSPPTKQTPPAPDSYANDNEASDLVDTPMQHTPVNNAVDLRYAPKIALHRDVHPELKEQSLKRLRDAYEEPEGLSSLSSLKQSLSSTSYDMPVEAEETRIIPEPIINTSQINRGKSPLNEIASRSFDDEVKVEISSMSPEIESPDRSDPKTVEEAVIAQIKAAADVSNRTTVSPVLETTPPTTAIDSFDWKIPEGQPAGANDATHLAIVKTTADDVSIDTDVHPIYHKRKRGRPPKDHSGTMPEENSPTDELNMTLQDNIVDAEIAVPPSEAESKKIVDQAHIELVSIEEKPRASKPTLKIRIAARLSDVDGKSPRSLKLILGEAPLEGKKVNKAKKSREEEAPMTLDERPTTKKFPIHIPSQQQLGTNDSTMENRAKEEEDEIANNSPKRSQKRKMVVTSESALLLSSPKLSPQQRKKRKKFSGKKEMAADDATGAEESIKDASRDEPVIAKMIRLKKLAPPVVAKHDSDIDNEDDNNQQSNYSKSNLTDYQVVESTDAEDDNLNHKLITPNEPKKIVEDVPSSIRSGRRAAQQANEKISSKNENSVPDLQGGKKKKKQKEGEKGNENTGVVTVDDCRWVQCDKCKKWRVIPSNVVDSLPDEWFCSDNIYDPKRANCDAPEQTDKEVAKEKKRKLKKKQRLMMQNKSENEGNDNEATTTTVATINETNVSETMSSLPAKPQEQKSNRDSSNLHVKKEKEKVTERSRTPQPFLVDEPPVSSAKPKRHVVAETSSIATPNEDNTDDQQAVSLPMSSKQERRLSAIGKKMKLVSGEGSQVESSKASNVNNANVDAIHTGVEVRRGRGRPRRNPGKDVVPSGGGNSTDGYKACDDDNLEWVQCEKCDKWRRLPSHISADDLPEQWYCEMNTWNLESASCDVPEDKADGMQDIGGFGGTGGMGLGKLTYRNLIFGSTGRKLNRPVTEKARAAESLFSIHQDEDEMPTRVLYSDSSAFISRGRPSLFPGEENENHMSVLELMSHSSLWAELRNAAAVRSNPDNNNFLGQYDRGARLASYTYETLPSEIQQPMKEMVLYYLGDDSKTMMSGEELFARGQNSTPISNLSLAIDKARQFWTINVVVTTVTQLVKEGSVECLQKRAPESSNTIMTDHNVEHYTPYYRKTVSFSSRRSTVSNESVDDHNEIASLTNGDQNIDQSNEVSHRASSRCMKIAKPWKHRFSTHAT